MPLLRHKGAFAIAAVIDIALNAHECPVATKALATRLGLPPLHLPPPDERAHGVGQDGPLRRG